MIRIGESEKEVIRPGLNCSILTDFDAQVTSDVGFMPFRGENEHFTLLAPRGDVQEGPLTGGKRSIDMRS